MKRNRRFEPLAEDAADTTSIRRRRLQGRDNRLGATDVTVETLDVIFKLAEYATSIDEDGDLVVEHPAVRVCVRVDPKNQYIHFLAAYGVKPFAEMEAKYFLANRLNDTYHLARFFLPDPDLLAVDYSLSYADGLTARALSTLFSRFAETVAEAVSECDDQDLII